MKKLLLILLCLPIIGFGQGSIISLTVFPTYPTETDTVYIYASLSFASSSCPLDVKSHSILGNNIVASTQHCLGMLTAICYNTDTFKINPLSTGTYTFDLTLSSGFGGPPCTSGIIPDDYDTITFNISTSVQQTYVPDDNFENYLEANGMGNGIPNDNYVITANINTQQALFIYGQNISDLTGIEDFVSLQRLNCQNNNLTTLDINSNSNLQILTCHNNQLTNLEISSNPVLYFLTCHNNYLSSLDLRNGNNNQFDSLWTYGNPNLNCISVDDSTWSANNWTGIAMMDTQHYFSNNCSGSTSIQEHTTNKELLKVTDLLGRETKQTNQPLFYIYDDGTVEKRIVIE